MSKIVLGLPLYHSLPVTFFTRLLKLNHEATEGIVTVDGTYITKACDVIVEKAWSVPGDWDRLVILEHDMIPPLDALVRLAAYGPEYPIVSAMYFGHQKPHVLIAFAEQTDGVYDYVDPATVQEWVDNPGLHECVATGFGLISISRHVLEDWPAEIPMFNVENGTTGSHDLWFCKWARQFGHRIYVDSNIVCDHLTQVPIGLADNQECATRTLSFSS